jgi:hypothetical protein
VDLDRVAATRHGHALLPAPAASAGADTITRVAPPVITLPSV